jgi:hypothetical protein
LALRLRVFSEQFHISLRVQFLARRGILRLFSCARNPAVTTAATIREIHRIIIPTSNNSQYEWMNFPHRSSVELTSEVLLIIYISLNNI